jgi:uncharacterized protein YggE
VTEREITVAATGEASVPPDTAVVSMGVTAKGTSLGTTRDDVNRRTSAVLAALRELGVTDGDVDAPEVSINPEYDYRRDAQKLIGYHVTRSVTARVRALDSLGDVLDRVVKAGADEVHGTQMTASDSAVAEHAALREAVASARAKAEALAEAAGVGLGAVVRIEEEALPGIAPMPMKMMASAEAAGVSTEVATGDLTISRRVRVTCEIA